MNEGDYIRYKIQNKYEDIVKIGKVSFIGVEEIQRYNREPRGELYCQVDNDFRNLYAKDIIKSSPNIIDLIEAGDYVNGRKVSKINLDTTFNKEKSILCGDFDYDCLETIYTNEDIKSIVTKEQFSNVEYKVGE